MKNSKKRSEPERPNAGFRVWCGGCQVEFKDEDSMHFFQGKKLCIRCIDPAIEKERAENAKP